MLVYVVELYIQADKIDEQILRDLIPYWLSVESKIKERIIIAHDRKLLRGIFRQPAILNPNFKWPFHINHEFKSLSQSDVEKDFFQMIKKIPAKAIHRNYTHPEIGRSHVSLQKFTFRVIKLSPGTRLPPTQFKELSKIAISNQTSPGETRCLVMNLGLGATMYYFNKAADKNRV